jgi:hypothetical protein
VDDRAAKRLSARHKPATDYPSRSGLVRGLILGCGALLAIAAALDACRAGEGRVALSIAKRWLSAENGTASLLAGGTSLSFRLEAGQQLTITSTSGLIDRHSLQAASGAELTGKPGARKEPRWRRPRSQRQVASDARPLPSDGSTRCAALFLAPGDEGGELLGDGRVDGRRLVLGE